LPRLFGTIFNYFLAICCHSIALVIVFTGRFSDLGRLCAQNVTPVEYEGDLKFVENGYTYADDAALILTFAVIECVICFT